MDDSRCSNELRIAGLPYGRTCGVCGLGPCKAQFVPAAAPSAPAPEIGWLIEMRFGDCGLLWWNGEFDQHREYGRARFSARMVNDAGKAVRFARREDAQRVLDAMLAARPCPMFGSARTLYSVQEHMWPVPKAPSAPAPAEVPDAKCVADLISKLRDKSGGHINGLYDDKAADMLEALKVRREELRKSVASLLGEDENTWPDHGNVELAVAASVALLHKGLEEKIAYAAAREAAERERVRGVLRKAHIGMEEAAKLLDEIGTPCLSLAHGLAAARAELGDGR